jgi:cell division protease FtsH
VLSIVLLRTIPDVVYSITTDADSQGFVYSSFAWKYISRKELIPRVAMMLGGYVAEELIFGKENLTSGASSDIEKATEFLSTMYKNNGMGQTPIKYSIPIKEENDSYHQFGAVEEEIKNAIEEAKLLAEKTLKSEQKLLLSLADFLSDNRMLRKNDIKRFVEKAISNNVDFIEDGDYLFYREHLKKQIKNFQVSKTSEYHFENVISLNKKYKD